MFAGVQDMLAEVQGDSSAHVLPTPTYDKAHVRSMRQPSGVELDGTLRSVAPVQSTRAVISPDLASYGAVVNARVARQHLASAASVSFSDRRASTFDVPPTSHPSVDKMRAHQGLLSRTASTPQEHHQIARAFAEQRHQFKYAPPP